MNQVALVGNISSEIDLRYTPNGHAVAKFNLAVNNPYNKDDVSFIPIEAWRKTAENTAEHCDKGSKVGIVGEIKVERYEKDGQNRTFTKVVAQNVEFISTRSSGGNNSQQSNQSNTGYKDDPFRQGGIEDPGDLPF